MNFSNNEYLKLYRKLATWEWYSNPITKSVFIDCLIFSNWKSGTWQGHEYKPGQFFTSYGSMAERNGISIMQVRTALNHLENSGEITRLKVGKSLLITVVKWSEYQLDNTKLTQNQHEDNFEITTDIRSKEDKKVRTISYSSDFEQFWSAYPKHQPSKAKSYESFKKAIKKTAINTMLKAIAEQKKSDQWKDAQYIPMATTWLNQERWEYEVKVNESSRYANACSDFMELL